MKTTVLTLFSCIVMIAAASAQAPEAMKYQTVVRNDAGVIQANLNIDMRFTIFIDGSEAYSEEHDVTTNASGLATVEVGTGTSSDDFEDINWADGAASMEVEVDDGSGYQSLGTSSLLSVPYALYAKEVENSDDADADPDNEIQSLSLNGNELAISDGNSVTLPSGGGDAESMAKAFARVDIFGNTGIFDTYNVISTTKSTTGVYIVNLEPGLYANPAVYPSVVCNVMNDLAAGVAIPTFGASPSSITVRTYDMDGNLADREFSITVHAQ